MRNPPSGMAPKPDAWTADDMPATPAEDALDAFLSQLAGGSLKGAYRREWPIGDWRVDFYFPDAQLAIEVDGGYHRAQSRWRMDQWKAHDLASRGITLLRLANAEVFGDRQRLVERLRAAWRLALRNQRHRARHVEEARECYRVRPPRSGRRPLPVRGAMRLGRAPGSPTDAPATYSASMRPFVLRLESDQ
jgi:very-short-patch-repair endonuclease